MFRCSLCGRDYPFYYRAVGIANVCFDCSLVNDIEGDDLEEIMEPIIFPVHIGIGPPPKSNYRGECCIHAICN